jgi:hypothetical protein
MTNSLRKITLALVAALSITATGCKKEDAVSTFSLDAQSLDFEWGQTKKLGYTYQYLRNFTVTDTPKGWTCTHSGGAYVITAPAAASSDVHQAGSITFEATRPDGTTVSRTMTVSVRIASEITSVANCVMVSIPGKRYKFNARRRGNETAETLTSGATAARMWSTSTTAIVNVSLEDGYIYFATGTAIDIEEANSVVALHDGDGNVIWSWHIWSTAFDPAAAPDVVDGMKVMNRNLGAFASSSASAGEAVRSFGLYYQWGRKDPFVGPREWNSTVPVSIFSGSTPKPHSYVASNEERGTIAWATANPGTFITGSEANRFDWLHSGEGADRWSATSKTVYDPCPAGWRVAPASIWKEFTTTGAAAADPAQFSVEGEYGYGWTFVVGEARMFYPAAGRHSFSPSLTSSLTNFTNVVNDRDGVGYPVGFYWSADYPATSAGGAAAPASGRSLVFRRDWVSPAAAVSQTADHAAAGGFPLRCVAE